MRRRACFVGRAPRSAPSGRDSLSSPPAAPGRRRTRASRRRASLRRVAEPRLSEMPRTTTVHCSCPIRTSTVSPAWTSFDGFTRASFRCTRPPSDRVGGGAPRLEEPGRPEPLVDADGIHGGPILDDRVARVLLLFLAPLLLVRLRFGELVLRPLPRGVVLGDGMLAGGLRAPGGAEGEDEQRDRDDGDDDDAEARRTYSYAPSRGRRHPFG